MGKRNIKPSHMLYELAKQSQKEILKEANTLIDNLLKKYDIPFISTQTDAKGRYKQPYISDFMAWDLRELAYKEKQSD